MLSHTLKAAALTATVEEAPGAPVTELLHRSTGCRLVLPPERQVRLAGAAVPWRIGGYRDCWPSIAPCRVAVGPTAVQVPPFGDLWTRHWSFPRRRDEIASVVSGRAIPYVFSRRIAADGEALRFEYRVENTGEAPVPWIWAGMLTLPLYDRMTVAAADGAEAWVQDEDRRRAHSAAWPRCRLPDGRVADLSRPVLDGGSVRAFLRTDRPAPLVVGLPGFGVRLRIDWAFDGASAYGLWLNGGGWPAGVEESARFVTVEPATAPFDRLEEAVAAGAAHVLAPGRAVEFSLALSVEPLGR